MAFVVGRYTRQIREAARAQRKREGNIAARAGEAISQIAVVKAFTREEDEGRSFAVETRAVLSAGVRAGRIEAAMQRGVEMFVAVGTGLVLWLGAHRVFTRTLSPGDLLVFTAYLKQMYRPIREIAGLINRTSKAQACAERVADILESEPETVERPGAIAAPSFQGALRFENVGLAYRPGAWAVRHVTFSVPAGARVAVIGPTGSGKSTLAGMVPRFHDPQEGALLVDGQDIRHFTLRSVREQVSLVLQEPMLFGGSIRENIAYGKANASEEEIVAAARAAFIHDFIQGLPDGYETRIAERGATLSGGQKQRLSVARAVLRNAPLLVLDEPTSGLDPDAESAVHLALHRLMKGRTTLLITHRMASAATADLIVVLEEGRVVGLGRHPELLGECSLYRRLVEQERSAHESLAV
jgi:ABC-type multidrug transport system fused ATPase/permease subunit